MPHRGQYTSFMLRAIVFIYVISRVVCSASEETVQVRRVLRRLRRDVYFYESTHESCNIENRTYLVDERQCVNNIELINGNKININNKLNII